MVMMELYSIAFFGNMQYGYHLKAFFEYFYTRLMRAAALHGKSEAFYLLTTCSIQP
jgi:hypothetical protein